MLSRQRCNTKTVIFYYIFAQSTLLVNCISKNCILFHSKFDNENGVIYTSNTLLTSYHLKKLLRHQVKTCRPGTKIIVLHGIHGRSDGLLGEEDIVLEKCFSLAIKQVIENLHTGVPSF